MCRFVQLMLVLLSPLLLRAQTTGGHDLFDGGGDEDKCGFSNAESSAILGTLGSNWGYGYADLLVDLERWRSSPYVRIDSLGTSVDGRAIWELTITAPGTPTSPRQTVYVHARTHPNEIQSFWVTKAMIEYLLTDNDDARLLRERIVFYIVPMYNPDGVERALPRENAHDVDLERGWDDIPAEPEVAALKRRFTELMSSDAPIRVALNMHSAYVCRRYFVFHEEAGTSALFTDLEREFITGVRSFFTTGIEPWTFNRTWKEGAPTHFPESWFWFNHAERVMALTYEDMNCASAGMYDSTAFALLRGVGQFLGVTPPSAVPDDRAGIAGLALLPNHPNPVTASTTIGYRLPLAGPVRLALFDLLGREVATLVDRRQEAGAYEIEWHAGGLPGGVYMLRLHAGDEVRSRRIVIAR